MDAPTGNVTFVFTDIEGSTPLWQAVPEAMKQAIAVHDAILREVFGRHAGYEFGTAGDAFKFSHADPCAAIAACLEAQVALCGADWDDAILAHPKAAEVRGPDGERLHRGLRVRMGIHLGPVEHFTNPTTGRTDYLGTSVNAAARVGDAGHGGQVVISRTAWDAARQVRSFDATVTPLGEHALRGVGEPEVLLQLLPSSLAGRTFPPLRTRTARHSNLLARRDAFLGREAELAELLEGLASSRMVTLLGPGGTGKTRLATELALEHAPRWPGGTWFCDLATARSRMDVLVLLASALRVPLPVDVTADTASATSGKVIAGLGHALLILDNFEQVVPHAADTVGRWLDAAPDVDFLVTSREPLGLTGERRIELAPLGSDVGVALFLDRARQVRPGFDVDPGERELLVTLVERLDGMPLAIELAASRVDVLSVRALSRRLDQRFRLLRGASTDRPDRQTTLRGAVDWSWDLLTPVEREALRQCAVFAGGFDVEAAEEVLDLDAFDEAPWPLDVVQSLRRKSLLREIPGAGPLRLGMYETIRAYAGEKLGTGPERAAAELRHATWYAGVAERCAEGMRLPGDVEKLITLRAELENLVAAHARMARDRPDLSARVIASIAPALELFGPAPHFLAMIEESIAGAERCGDRELLVRVLRGKAFALAMAARPVERDRVLARAEEVAREERLEVHLAEIRRERAMGAFYQIVPMDRALSEMEAARDELLRLGRPALASIAGLLTINMRYFVHGPEGLIQRLDHAIDAIRAHAGERDLAWANQDYGQLAAWGMAPIDRGAEALREGVEVARRCGDRSNLAIDLAGLGMIEAVRGREEAALALFDEAEELIAPMAGAPGRQAQVRLAREVWTLRQAADARIAGDPARSDALLAEVEARVARVYQPGPPTPDHPEGDRSLAERSSAVQISLMSIRSLRAMLDEDPHWGLED